MRCPPPVASRLGRALAAADRQARRQRRPRGRPDDGGRPLLLGARQLEVRVRGRWRDAHGARGRQRLARLVDVSEPAWSPDGATIAYVTPNQDIYGVSPGGATERRIVGEPVIQMRPTWSIEGGQLAFLAQTGQGEPWTIGVVRPDGSGLRAYDAPLVINAYSLSWDQFGTALVAELSAASSCSGFRTGPPRASRASASRRWSTRACVVSPSRASSSAGTVTSST